MIGTRIRLGDSYGPAGDQLVGTTLVGHAQPLADLPSLLLAYASHGSY